MTVLPPGQIETRRFPVVGERTPSPEIEDWRLEIGGLVRDPRILSLGDYMALDHREVTLDIHCVTSWTRFGNTFTGIPLVALVAPFPEARCVSFEAFRTGIITHHCPSTMPSPTAGWSTNSKASR